MYMNGFGIRRDQELTASGLKDLLSGCISVLVVEDFVSQEHCGRVLARILDSNVAPYEHEELVEGRRIYSYYGVDRSGVPFNSTIGELKPEERDERRSAYYGEVLAGTRRYREARSGSVSPIDLLRLQLDEVWPFGASVAAFEGKKMLCGIARVMEAERSRLTEENPHFDALPESIMSLKDQFAANIFIETPTTGGAFIIWDKDGRSSMENGSSRLDKAALEQAPSMRVRILPGTLVLFRTGNWHTVESFPTGLRISLQCFIGQTADDRLHLWN